MKHIEASAKIVTSGVAVDPSSVKYSLVQRLRNAFHIETVGEGMESFSVSGTSKATSYVFTLNILLKSEPNRVRVVIDGTNSVSKATQIFYVLSLLAVLALGLFPNTIEEGGMGHGLALESIFFLVVGGFIILDMHRKFEEPQLMLDRIMRSLEAEFG